MGVSYDLFIEAFLAKISEFEFIEMPEDDRTTLVDGFLTRAVAGFRKNCKYDFITTRNDETRTFSVEVSDDDMDELVEIISEGMVVQWLKSYLNKQENLENTLSTKDFTTFSPATLLNQVRATYKQAKRDYTQMIREYSYNHGDLTVCHT